MTPSVPQLHCRYGGLRQTSSSQQQFKASPWKWVHRAEESFDHGAVTHDDVRARVLSLTLPELQIHGNAVGFGFASGLFFI